MYMSTYSLITEVPNNFMYGFQATACMVILYRDIMLKDEICKDIGKSGQYLKLFQYKYFILINTQPTGNIQRFHTDELNPKNTIQT